MIEKDRLVLELARLKRHNSAKRSIIKCKDHTIASLLKEQPTLKDQHKSSETNHRKCEKKISSLMQSNFQAEMNFNMKLLEAQNDNEKLSKENTHIKQQVS